MKCFDLYINGEKICRAGMEELGVMSCIIGFAKESEHYPEDELAVSLGGLYVNPAGDSVHPRWIERTNLNVGDEIKIRIVESEDSDLPVKEFTETAEWLKERKREYFERTKAEFED